MTVLLEPLVSPLITSRGLTNFVSIASGPSPEDFGTLARALDANVLTGANGIAVPDAPNVSSQTSTFVPGYVQANPANQPILGTAANGHRFIERGGTDRFLRTASHFNMLGTHTFIVARIAGTGTSIMACQSGANSKIESSGTTPTNSGPRAAGAPAICGNALDRKNLSDIVHGRWTVFELYLPDGVAGAYIAVDGVIKITTTNIQNADVPMDTLFSAIDGYPGVRPDPAIALKYVYSVGSTPMSAPNRSGALSLVQSRANEMNGL